jgi:hypothetical protein
MKFVLADERIEAQLRGLVRTTPMPGSVEIAYTREPDFFRGAGLMSSRHQVLAALDGDRVVGLGCRAIRRMYVNGRPENVGYLSGLRLLPEVRSATALARGYEFLKTLHADGGAPAYLTTIVEKNRDAIALLTSGRAGLPRYEDRGRYLTYALPVPVARREFRSWGVDVRTAADLPAAALSVLLGRGGVCRQFYPVAEAGQFGTASLPGLAQGDVYVARRGPEVLGVAAAWDLGAVKQNLVCAYHGAMRACRPLINRLLPQMGRVPLPAPGEQLRTFSISLIHAVRDDPRVFGGLIDFILNARAGSGYHMATVGLHESDPLRAAVARRFKFTYPSRLFLVRWEDGEDFCRGIDRALIPYLELAAL